QVRTVQDRCHRVGNLVHQRLGVVPAGSPENEIHIDVREHGPATVHDGSQTGATPQDGRHRSVFEIFQAETSPAVARPALPKKNVLQRLPRTRSEHNASASSRLGFREYTESHGKFYTRI